MLLRFSLVLLTALALHGAPKVGLLVETPATLPPSAALEFRMEADRLLHGIGAEYVWRGMREGRGETFERVVVIKLKGACGLATPPGVLRHQALGITHISDGRVLPFVEIDCERVLGAASERNTPFLTPALVGRSLARVAVHEILHVLTGYTGHDTEGITKASFSAADFGCVKMTLARAAVERLRRALDHQPGGNQSADAEE